MPNPFSDFLLTRIASTEGFLILTLGLLMVFLWKKDIRGAVILFLCSAGLILTLNILKESLRVPRPENALIEVTGYAFPSGHAGGSAFLALIVIFLARKLRPSLRIILSAVALTCALFISVSRITYHVHTPLQVLCGFALGAFFAFVFIYTNLFDTKYGKCNSTPVLTQGVKG